MRDEEFKLKIRALVKEHYPNARSHTIEVDAPKDEWDHNVL